VGDSWPDRASVEVLYRKHAPALLLFAASLSCERCRAQDAVHQVFLKLLESGDLRNAKDIKAYLFASVRNAVLNDLTARQRDVPLDPETMWFRPPDRDYSSELKLRQSLSALPEDQRSVIVLHVWGDLTFSQIGEILAISPNTVASRYRYALAKLREAMCVKERFCVRP
jgi:RNA polymerase sigma-70 factor, ECF subfamily